MQEIPLDEAGARNIAADGAVVSDLNAKSLDSLLADTIDQILDDILGRRAKEAIYDYMERNYSVSREDIPKNLDKFFVLMEDLFGKGSKTVAKSIIRRLWQRLGWKFTDVQGFEFSDFLEAARARIGPEPLEKFRARLLSER